MMLSRIAQITLSTALLSALAGCGDSGVHEVKQWMDEVKQQTKVSIPKLTEPKKFAPFVYEAQSSIDPYNPTKLEVAFAKAQSGSHSGVQPNLDRRREPLEAYPLDTIRMVGTLQKPRLSYAVLQVDKTVFQVKVGNYIGQNLGIVTNITDNTVELKEVIQDASGEWVERKAKLELQETKK
jgi:type IV pilus assembly protein PilP